MTPDGLLSPLLAVAARLHQDVFCAAGRRSQLEIDVEDVGR